MFYERMRVIGFKDYGGEVEVAKDDLEGDTIVSKGLRSLCLNKKRMKDAVIHTIHLAT